MVKKLIFDLDNTLIMWKDEYVNAIGKSIKKFKINCEANYMSDLVDEYEKYYDRYDKKNLMEFINNNIEDKVDIDFVEDFIYNIGFCADIDEDVIDTLEYLSKKYELVVLTNWFTVPQTNRLKIAKIDKYFKEIFGGDEYIKPQKEAFLQAAGNTPVEECIMIGDSYTLDVMGAYNVGIKPIFMNPKHKPNEKKFEEITKLNDLKNIL
jgi:putative hydrolase of the HAD superfamily